MIHLNISSKKHYTKNNITTLSDSCQRNNYCDIGNGIHYWITFNQARDMGLLIKKGSKGTKIHSFHKDENDREVYRGATVFHHSQLEEKPESKNKLIRTINSTMKMQAFI